MNEQKRRVNLTVHPSLYEKAQTMMGEDCFADFSGYIENLIRSEWQRRASTLTPERISKTLAPYAIKPSSQTLNETPAKPRK